MKFISPLPFQHRKKPLTYCGAIAAVILLFGCSPQSQTISCQQPQLPQQVTEKLKQTPLLQLSVLLDGTLSMQGFVNNQPDSRYRQTLRLIESASSTGWNNAAAGTKYYRFGTKKRSIDRETFLKAQLPVFYQGGSDFSTSKIDAALSEPGNEKLSVILTDLYQKDADVSLIQKLLAQNYLDKGYSIGVVGIKSEFQGTVYDVGIANRDFAYSTAGKSASALHPFYVLLVGSYGNIDHFYDQLLKNGLTSVEHEFIVFSTLPAERAATLSASEDKALPRKDILQPKALNNGQVLVRKQTPSEPVQFLVVTSKTSDQPISIELPYKSLRGTLPPDPNAIVATVQKYQSQSKGFQPSDSQGFQLTDWKIADQSLQFQAKIQPDQLDSGIYLFNFDASPTNFVEPDWWNRWNATEGTLDGSKTNNLLPFLRGLKLRTAELMKRQKPVIAKLCYAIQKK